MLSGLVLGLAALPLWSCAEAAALNYADTQIIIQSRPNISQEFEKSTGSIYLPLETNYTHDLVYFTHIDIGTPPQRFRVLVDLSTPDTFISSIECTTCLPGDNRYDATQSSTSQPDSNDSTIDNYYFVANGPLVKDVVHLNGLSVRQTFLAASTAVPIGSSWDDIRQIHGFLGLAPSSRGSDINRASLLMNLAAQRVLDHNVISIRLREPKGLTLGFDATVYDGDIQYLPLTHKTPKTGRPGSWQTQATSLTLNSRTSVHFDLSGLTAMFSMADAFIILPTEMAFFIVKALEFEDIPFTPPVVPCDRRHTMPDLTFNLAGTDFTLTPWDYTLEWPSDQSDQLMCASAIMPSGMMPGEDQEIVLGNAFLRKYLSIWDIDEQRIGFAELT